MNIHVFAPIKLVLILLGWNGWVVANDNPIEIKSDEKFVTATVGGRPILVYNHATLSPPKGIDALYSRSGHIHPLYTPNGKKVTDDFSDDHAHQHGLFFAFVKAKLDGENLDFWNQHKKTANVRFQSYKVNANKTPMSLSTQQIHYRLKDKKVVFEESWVIVPTLQNKCFIIDFSVALKNVTESPVVIEKNHYGSFGMRGASQWRNAKRSQFDFTTSNGKNRKNGNQSRESWVAMHGKIDGADCGVAVIGDPGNFRHPQPARLHPTMPYFSFAPMALEKFTIESGKTYRSKFRIVTFDGPLDIKKINGFKNTQ